MKEKENQNQTPDENKYVIMVNGSFYLKPDEAINRQSGDYMLDLLKKLATQLNLLVSDGVNFITISSCTNPSNKFTFELVDINCIDEYVKRKQKEPVADNIQNNAFNDWLKSQGVNPLGLYPFTFGAPITPPPDRFMNYFK